MAKYTIVPTCGHNYVVTLSGAHSARQARIEKLERGVCADCRKAERMRAASVAAAKRNAAANLPALEGTERQINWAEVIRDNAAESLLAIREREEKRAEDARMSLEIIDAMLSTTNASEWIARRAESFGENWLRYRLHRRKKAESTAAD